MVEARRDGAHARMTMSPDRVRHTCTVTWWGELVCEFTIDRLGARDTSCLVDAMVNIAHEVYMKSTGR